MALNPEDVGTAEVSSLIYLSRTTRPIDGATIDEIALISALRNAEIDVTGFLTFSEPYFTQYLEGPTNAVSDLLEKIRRDPRHDVTTVVALGDDVRRFPDWSMRLLDSLWHSSAGPIETIFDLLTVSTGDPSSGQKLEGTLRRLVSEVSTPS